MPAPARPPSRPAARLAGALAALAAALACAAPGAAAQSVQGVVDAGGGPVPPDLTAALLDSAGARVAPRLVPASGRFTLAAPAAGTYRVALYRVGYARVESAPLRLAAGAEVPTVRLRPPLARVSLAGVARLDAVQTSARAGACTPRPDAGAAALLWEEVRKALDAAALAQDAGVLDAATAEYWREVAAGGGRVRRERRVEGWARVRAPYVTRPAAELLGEGFVRAAGDSVAAYAPDARLLLDPRFHAAYCFGVRTRGAPEPGAVGLTFAPAAAGGPVGVRGVLWVDERTAELRSLHFEYVHLPGRWAALAGPLAAAGGRVDYARLPSGLWVVRSWQVRLPRPSARPIDPLATPPRHTVESVWEMGGELADAERVEPGAPDPVGPAGGAAGPARRRPAEVVTVAGTVQVLDARGSGLASATVAVDSGAPLAADSAGRVALDRLLVGARAVRVRAPGYAPFDSVLTVPPVADFALAIALDSAAAPPPDVVTAAAVRLGAAARDSARAAARRVTLGRASALDGFERRRRGRLGVYLTRDDIARRRPRAMEDVFRGVLGLVVDQRGVRAVRPGFGVQTGASEEIACFPVVFVDGTRVSAVGGQANGAEFPGGEQFPGLTPQDLEGVEVYRGLGVTPPEFAGQDAGLGGERTGCAAIVLWTRRGAAPAPAPAPR